MQAFEEAQADVGLLQIAWFAYSFWCPTAVQQYVAGCLLQRGADTAAGCILNVQSACHRSPTSARTQ